jgi:hypothetical protein
MYNVCHVTRIRFQDITSFFFFGPASIGAVDGGVEGVEVLDVSSSES